MLERFLSLCRKIKLEPCQFALVRTIDHNSRETGRPIFCHPRWLSLLVWNCAVLCQAILTNLLCQLVKHNYEISGFVELPGAH